jgi:hypothetical protein
VDLVGKVVQFGRGMIEEVSKQLFRQFSACVKYRLEVASVAVTVESESDVTTPEAEPKSLSVAPLAFQAMWAVIKRFFLRLIGSKA